MSISNPGHDTLVVTGEGSAAADTLNLQQAAATLSLLGKGTLVYRGTILQNDKYTLTGGISVHGYDSDALLMSSYVGGGNLIEWNPLVTVDVLEAGAIPITAARGLNSIGAVGHPWKRGDWIWIMSNDLIPDVGVHYGQGYHQCPGELWNISEVTDVDAVLIEGYVIDSMTTAANARGFKVPMIGGVTVKNLRIDFDESLLPPPKPDTDFSAIFRMRGLEGAHIEKSVQVLRNGPGCIWASLCANWLSEADVLGSYSQDQNYAYQNDGTNGYELRGVNVHGTRHPCDTTASKQEDNGPFAATTIAGDRVSQTAHGFGEGDPITFDSVAGSGLPLLTACWVRNPGTNDYQVATAPGGTTLPITSGEAVSVRQRARWGTPLGMVVTGTYYCSAKRLDPGGGTLFERSGPNTHQEGYGARISMDCIISGDDTACFVGNARGRATVFHDMNCWSDSAATTQAKGIRLAASYCKIKNVTFYNFWQPSFIQTWVTNQAPVTDCEIDATFVDCAGAVVIVSYGTDHKLKLRCKRSGTRSGGNPFQNLTLVMYTDQAGSGQVITGSDLYKDGNDWAIDVGQLTDSDIRITGNNLTGYGSGEPGIGRKIDVSSIDTGANSFTTSRTHGLLVDDRVEFITTGSFPSPIVGSTKYWVVDVPTTTTFKVSLTQGGIPEDLTGSFSPVLSVVSPYYNEIRAAVAGRNFIDP